MVKFYSMLCSFAIFACALVAPNGTRDLEMDMYRDMASGSLKEPLEGLPIFVRVLAHTRGEEGSITGRHWLLVNLGREKLSLEALKKRLEEESD